MIKQFSADETHEYYLHNIGARRFVLFVICIGSMLGPFALTSVNLALPTIALDLNANAVIVSWMAIGFLLSSVMFMLPIGKLSDRYGRKRFYFWGVLSNVIISSIASFAPNMEWLLVCRLFQGLSMAMVFGSGMAIVSSIYPPSERGSAIGLYIASVYAALTISPILGGWVTEIFGWRSVFWIQVPPSILTILMMLTVKGEWRDPVEKPFDWTGSLIFACWAGTLVYGLSGLPKAGSVVTFVLSFAYFWLFVFHQKRIAYPLVNIQLIQENRIFSFSLLAAVLIYAASYPLSFLLSLFLQFVLNYSPVDAGSVLLLQALIMALVSPFSGKLADRFEARHISTLGCILMALGFFEISFISMLGSSSNVITIGLLLIGLGFGLFSTPNINAAMSSVPRTDVGFASASINLARTIGNLFGMSLVGLLIYTFIGANTFTVEKAGELTSTLLIWVYIAIACAICAAFLSALRGKPEKDRDPELGEELDKDLDRKCDDLII